MAFVRVSLALMDAAVALMDAVVARKIVWKKSDQQNLEWAKAARLSRIFRIADVLREY